MPSYSVDSIRQAMRATGIVAPVMEWEESSDGKRRPSKDHQQRNGDTGMPLWAVEVLQTQYSFGQAATVPCRVTVGAAVQPEPSPNQPIGFNGLHVEVRVNKTGALTEIWSAESLIEAGKSGQSEKKVA